METVELDVKYKESASRIELFVRIFLAIVYGILLYIWGILAGFVQIGLWFYMLIKGKRHKGMSSFIERYIRFLIRVNAYLRLLTDERPLFSGKEQE